MKIIYRHIAILAGVAFAVLLPSCDEEVPEYREDLCSGYWLENGSEFSRLLKFDVNGEIFRYLCSYDDGDERYYAYYDTSSGGSYLMDAENCLFCFLPEEEWYDIYLLTSGMFVLGGGEEVVKYHKVKDLRVRVVSKKEFMEKFPASED